MARIAPPPVIATSATWPTPSASRAPAIRSAITVSAAP